MSILKGRIALIRSFIDRLTPAILQPFRRKIIPAFCKKSLLAAFSVWLYLTLGLIAASAQSSGSSTSVSGTVLDPSGAVVPGATIEIQNPVSHFDHTTTTDSVGKFTIQNVPFNPYHLTVTGTGFSPYAQDIDVRSVVPLNLSIGLQVAGSSQSVTVEASGEDLLENTSVRSTPTWIAI
jgi:hypothetical protein